MACPVYDPEIRKELQDYFNLQFRDNVKARVVDANQLNQYKKDQHLPCRSQEEIYKYLKNKFHTAKVLPVS